jgi:hypothetical protein
VARNRIEAARALAPADPALDALIDGRLNLSDRG